MLDISFLNKYLKNFAESIVKRLSFWYNLRDYNNRGVILDELDREQKETKQKSLIFTKETFGVVLILFSTLSLVCLITRESVFSDLGQYVNAFLLGCFGYFAYAVCFYLFLLGILLVSGKKINLSKKRKALITLLIFSIVLILQVETITSDKIEFGEYLLLCYEMGAGGVSTACAGGLFTGLSSYFLCKLLTDVGCYVMLGLAIALLTFALVKGFMKSLGEKKKEPQRFRSSYVEETETTTDGTEQEFVESEHMSDGQSQVSQPSQNANQNARQRLFINSPESFAFKNKREIQKDTGASPIRLEFSEGGLNVVRTENAKNNTIKKDDDYKKKIEYIKTPTIIDMEKYSSTNYYGDSFGTSSQTSTTVSDYISPSNAQNNAQNNTEIPFIEHDNGAKQDNDDSAEARAMAFEERYLDGGLNVTQVDEVEPTESIEQQNTYVQESPYSFTEPKNEEKPIVEKAPEMTSRASRFDFNSIEKEDNDPPMIEVDGDDSGIAEFSNGNNFVSEFVEDEHANDEELPQTNLRTNDRLRDVFVSEKEEVESVGYTSRVSADNNMPSETSSRRSFMFEEVKKPEPKPEVAPPPKPAPPINREYFRPPLDLLESYAQPFSADQENHEERKAIIKRTLEEFRIDVVPHGHVQGPSITRYEIMMPAGVSVKSVLKYDDDLKMRLSAKNGVRIEAPIPGKNLVGIEVANNVPVTVGLKEVLEGLTDKKDKSGSLMFAIGKDVVGNSISDDLAKGPHFLVAGSTGSGKSVSLHIMLVSMIMRYSPEELRLVLVDPKSVEFVKYKHLPHLLVDEIITEPKRALSLLQWAYDETNRRNELFTSCGGYVSNIDDYNSTIASDTVPKLPRIVFVIDELADLMEACKKDLEIAIRRIAAKSRSAGIHLVLATQRPSVDVITGTIKTNLPARIALKVINFNDSQTILGMGGAEKLLGKGDMLYKNSNMSDYTRYQGAFISNREIYNVVEYIKEKNTAYYDDEIMQYVDNATKPAPEEPSSGAEEGGANEEFSEFFLKALWFAVKQGSISISLLQRRFSIGWPRAGSIFDKMEHKGFIAPNEGGKARRVLLTQEEYVARFGPGIEEY